MATNFPTSLDNFSNPGPSSNMDDPAVQHDVQHANLNDAVSAIEARIGISGSSVSQSLEYRLSKANTWSAPSSSTVPGVFKGSASQSAALLEFRNSANALLASITAVGNYVGPKVQSPLIADSNDNIGYIDMGGLGVAGSVAVRNRTAVNSAFTVRGAASQSGSLQEWQNNAGSPLAKIGPTGSLISSVSGDAISVGSGGFLKLDSSSLAGGRLSVGASSIGMGSSGQLMSLTHYGSRTQYVNGSSELSQTTDGSSDINRSMRRYTNVGLTSYIEQILQSNSLVNSLIGRSSSPGGVYSNDLSFVDGRWGINAGLIAPNDTLVVRSRSGTEMMRLTEAAGLLGINQSNPFSAIDARRQSGSARPVARFAGPNGSGHDYSSVITPINSSSVVYASGAYYDGSSSPASVAQSSSAAQFEQSAGVHNWYSNTGLTAGAAYSRSLRMSLDTLGNLLLAKDLTAGSGFYDGVNAYCVIGNIGDNDNVYLDAKGATADVGIIQRLKGTGKFQVFSSSTQYLGADNLGVTSSSGETALSIQHAGLLKRVFVGAADSGGSGYRALRITN